MKNRVIIHIGLHKTGTTFLQNFIFPCYSKLSIIRAWYSHRKIIEMPLKSNILITDEGISGNPFKENYFEEFTRNLLNIKKLYGDPKIIIGLRKHSSFVLSLYKQYLHEKGTLDINKFFNVENSGILRLQDLFFKSRLDFLFQYFSEVFIYTHQELQSELDIVMNRLSIFLDSEYDAKEYKSIKNRKANLGIRTTMQVGLLRNLNYLNSSKFCPDLYGTKLTKYKFTPRDICQDRLKLDRSRNYELSEDLEYFIDEFYKKDWESVIALKN